MRPFSRFPVRSALPAFFSALFILSACGGGTDPNGGGGGGGGGGSNSLAFTVDGTAYTADQNSIQVSSSNVSPGTLVISGIKLNGTDYVGLTLILGFISGTGTYPIGVNQGTNAGGSANVLVKTGVAIDIWLTDFSGNAGTVTITGMTATRVTGTFAFSAPPQVGGGAVGTKVVTNGSFDVPIPASFVLPPADDEGAKISALLNGTPWNGATVLGVGDLGVGAFSMGGTTSGISLSLTTQTTVSEGNTYDETGMSLIASGQGVNCCWGGPGSTSSVTFSSITATRVVGTFTASLVPQGGSGASTNLVITQGSFDIKIFSGP